MAKTIQKLIVNYKGHSKGCLVKARQLSDARWLILGIARCTNGVNEGDTVEVSREGRSYPVVKRVVERGRFTTIIVEFKDAQPEAVLEAVADFVGKHEDVCGEFDEGDKEACYLSIMPSAHSAFERYLYDRFGGDVEVVQTTLANTDFDPAHAYDAPRPSTRASGSVSSGGGGFLAKLFPWMFS